jgi:type I restriction enzyme S subunit
MTNKVRLGGYIDTRKGYAFKSGWYTDEGVPIVKVSDFTYDSVDASNLVCISEEIASAYKKYELKTGDVVIQTVGSWPSNPQSVVGKVIKVPKEASRALLNQNAVKLIPNNYLHQSFLYYLLRNQDFKSHIIGCAQGAASQASITLDAIREYKFLLPSIASQEKISDILSAYDCLIENNTRRIKLLEEIARSLYNEWFVKFRFSGHEQINTNSWQKVKLKDVCREITVGHVGSMANEYVEKGIPFLRSQNILPFNLNLDSIKYITHEFHKKLKKSALSPGDVAVVRTGYPGTACVIPSTLPIANCADLVIIRPSEKINAHYIAYIFNSIWGQKTVAGSLVGVAQQHFNVGAAKEMIINLPPDSIQQKFSNFASTVFSEIETLQAKNQNLRKTRDLLLPKLISGEIDMERWIAWERKGRSQVRNLKMSTPEIEEKNEIQTF